MRRLVASCGPILPDMLGLIESLTTERNHQGNDGTDSGDDGQGQL
jgi:hypothetical protein